MNSLSSLLWKTKVYLDLSLCITGTPAFQRMCLHAVSTLCWPIGVGKLCQNEGTDTYAKQVRSCVCMCAWQGADGQLLGLKAKKTDKARHDY